MWLSSQLYPPASGTGDHEIVNGIVTVAPFAGASNAGAGGGSAAAVPPDKS